MSAGYSGTPLARKLGIKDGHSVLALHAPSGYLDLLEGLPDNVSMRIHEAGQGQKEEDGSGSSKVDEGEAGYDLIHFFTDEKATLEAALPELKARIVRNGCIWASWPKKASKVPTDVDGNVVRGLALRTGLVDVKICAVDETWSGLKLVIPVKDRPKEG